MMPFYFDKFYRHGFMDITYEGTDIIVWVYIYVLYVCIIILL